MSDACALVLARVNPCLPEALASPEADLSDGDSCSQHDSDSDYAVNKFHESAEVSFDGDDIDLEPGTDTFNDCASFQQTAQHNVMDQESKDYGNERVNEV